MRLTAVIDALEQLAPLHLAQPWDKIGLQLGGGGWQVRRALLCIDLTEPVLAEAAGQKADLIVAYHPPVFSPLERLIDSDPKQRILLEAARRRIAIYSPHTALDAASGGVNDWLCEGFGPGRVEVIEPAQANAPSNFKLVTFAPAADIDHVRDALTNAGAGVIGRYADCSFNTSGWGTFKGDAKTRPTVGRAGRFERVDEIRIEMVVAAARLADAVTALRTAHPYEEPAFDIYRLEPPPGEADTNPPAGQGRTVLLDRPVRRQTLIGRIKKHLGTNHLEVASPPASRTKTAHRPITKVALCAGAGASVIAKVADADLLFTGEMRHHDVLAAVAQNKSVVLAGHTQTERPYLPVYRDRIKKITGAAIQWRISKADLPPSQIL